MNISIEFYLLEIITNEINKCLKYIVSASKYKSIKAKSGKKREVFVYFTAFHNENGSVIVIVCCCSTDNEKNFSVL